MLGSHGVSMEFPSTGIPLTRARERTFRVSLFKNQFDNEPKLQTYTLSELAVLFTKQLAIRAEKEGRAFSPAIFRGPRRKENVIELTLLALDYDHHARLTQDLRPWRERNLLFMVYTTHSHLRQTESNPHAEERFRVILPLATPIPASQFAGLWAWAAKEAGDKADPKAGKDIARLHFLPAIAHPKAPFWSRVYNGDLLDWRTLDLALKSDTTHYALAGQRGSCPVSFRYAAAALEGELARVRSALRGARNDTLNKAAFALGQLIGGGWLSENEVLAKLKEAAARVGLPPNEARRTIRSGLEAGKHQPRAVRSHVKTTTPVAWSAPLDRRD